MTNTVTITGITTQRDPAGYSEGSYGYRVEWTNKAGQECASFDGGYASRELALEAAQAWRLRNEDSL